MAMLVIGADNANAAARVSVRGTPVATGRQSVTRQKTTGSTTASTTVAETPVQEKVVETIVESVSKPAREEQQEYIIENKSSGFSTSVTDSIGGGYDNSFAEMIRKQKDALAASEANLAQQQALVSSSNICDRDLRKCMMEKCGSDFTKCATDGDTIFGDKLNACRGKTTCDAHEFSVFTAEIKADLEMNLRLASYDNVISCGNEYNACIVDQCGNTYNKCLGKVYADAAVQKFATIAKNCMESDSGLANRFGTAIGKLRESAEKDVKKDEERMYALRDLMSDSCKRLGAMFDERTFDCVFTVNFFAGENQSTPTATRKRYAGDVFICMQEWFGINATTFKENAFRETRAQTAASSAMLGSGLGTAAGLIASGAIDRALDTQKAKKELKEECEAQGMKMQGGKCVEKSESEKAEDEVKATKAKEKEEEKTQKIKDKEQKRQENQRKKDEKEQECLDGGGTKYTPGVCWCPAGEIWKSSEKKCVKISKKKDE